MKRRTYLATASGALAGSAGCLGGGRNDTNYVFTSHRELAAVSRFARNGDEPWASAWEALKRDADRALAAPMRSVVDDDGDHEFTLDDNARHDYRAAQEMGTSARDTALAYFVSGEDRFARRAIDAIHHWMLAADTHMAPVGGSGPGGNPEQFITLPRFWYAASLVRDHPHWQTKSSEMPWRDGSANDAEAAFQRWVRDYTENVENDYQNNIYVRWQVCEGSAYVYLEDETSFERLVERYKGEQTWNDYNDCTTDRPGTFEREIHRSDPFSYQLVRMKAHMQFCEVARHRGYDLYSYTAPTDSCDGSTLRNALDAMIPFVRDPSRWEYLGKRIDDEGLEGTREHIIPSVYELAFSRWRDDRFREVIDVVSTRPITDERVLGWVTFTHGNLFALSDSLFGFRL
jgi:hypothetical protein